MAGRCLEAFGESLVLDDIAVAAIHHHMQAVVAKRLFIGGADLLVVDALARVVALGQGAFRVLCIRRVDFTCTRVCGKRGPGGAQRILRIALVQAVGDDGQLAVRIGLDGDLAERLFARGGAVVAEAVRAEARTVEYVADAACLALRRQVYLAGAETAARHIQFDGRGILPILGKQLDHAARMVAIDGRKRSAQHFDALGRIEVEGSGLALAIGHAGRNAIADQFDTAHAEGRAGAEAARRDLQVLRVVLAVLHNQARHGSQRFRRIDADLTILDAGAVDHVDRGRHFLAGVGDAAAADDHRIHELPVGQISCLGGENVGGEGGAAGDKQAGNGVQAETMLHAGSPM